MMSSTNKFVFIALQIIAWLIFVGLSIEAGGLIVNFAFAVFKPETVPLLYQTLDLSDLYERSATVFYQMYSFILVIAILKCVLFYIVIMMLMKLNLAKPFDNFVSRQISKISYYTFSIGILSYLARQSAKNLTHKGFVTDNLSQFWGDSQAYVFMAAVIYAIAIIFQKGLEIQNENDLTV